MACTPQELVTSAICIDNCIPEGAKMSVLVSLAAQIAGVSVDSQSLADRAKCIDCSIPRGMMLAVLVSIACEIAS